MITLRGSRIRVELDNHFLSDARATSTRKGQSCFASSIPPALPGHQGHSPGWDRPLGRPARPAQGMMASHGPCDAGLDAATVFSIGHEGCNRELSTTPWANPLPRILRLDCATRATHGRRQFRPLEPCINDVIWEFRYGRVTEVLKRGFSVSYASPIPGEVASWRRVSSAASRNRIAARGLRSRMYSACSARSAIARSERMIRPLMPYPEALGCGRRPALEASSTLRASFLKSGY